MQAAEEVLDLVDGDGVADADIDAHPLLEGNPAVDPDDFPLGVEEGAAGIAGIDRSVGLNAVGVLNQGSRRILIAMHSRNHAEGHCRLEVGGQQERIADGEAPVAGADEVAVGQRSGWEVSPAEELDQRHIAHRINADDDGVVKPVVGHAALHVAAGRLDDVEIRQGVSFRRNHHSAAAAGPFLGKHADGGPHGAVNRLNAGLLCLDNGWGRINGEGGTRQCREEQ
jgi:hypothetical protein